MIVQILLDHLVGPMTRTKGRLTYTPKSVFPSTVCSVEKIHPESRARFCP